MLLVLAGVALVAFGAWSFAQQGPAKPADDIGTKTVLGGGSDGLSDVDIARAARDDAAPSIKDASTAKAPKARAIPAAPAAPRSTNSSTQRPRAARPAGRNTGRDARRVAGVGAVAARPAATAGAARAARRTVAGGGGPTGELPMTGLETWIAGFLGVLLLAFGIGVHVNAVRLGMTALLYRRGILLRPVDCARLAHDRGLVRLRVMVSNVLHRLLEEPATRGDFVSARLLR